MLCSYICDVTQCYRSQKLKKAALRFPSTATAYAREIKSRDSDLKTKACESACSAYEYTIYVENSSSDETREAACMDYEYGVRYLAEIDNFGYSDCMARFLNSSKKARSFLRIHFSEAAKIDWFSAILEKYP